MTFCLDLKDFASIFRLYFEIHRWLVYEYSHFSQNLNRLTQNTSAILIPNNYEKTKIRRQKSGF